MLNPLVNLFKIAIPNEDNNAICIDKGDVNFEEIDLTTIPNLESHYSPKKSIRYLIKRYKDHPVYQYLFIGAYKSSGLCAVFVLRKIVANGGACLRIIDILGDYSNLGYLGNAFVDLLRNHECEYIDCLNYGIEPQIFFSWGLLLRDDKNIIPNYFEPFQRENVDIRFAFKTEVENYVIFKGDSDQDRPSIINEGDRSEK